MRRHRFDPISFVFGAAFSVVGLAFAAGDPDLANLRLRWAWPLTIAVVGGLIIVVALARGREHAPASPDGSAAAPETVAVALAPEPDWPQDPHSPSDPDSRPEAGGADPGPGSAPPFTSP